MIGTPLGMSRQTIAKLARWYEETFRAHPEMGTWLDSELRRRLREEFGVLPEFVEVEAERVMDRLFEADGS
jgi:hypothetical protein